LRTGLPLGRSEDALRADGESATREAIEIGLCRATRFESITSRRRRFHHERRSLFDLHAVREPPKRLLGELLRARRIPFAAQRSNGTHDEGRFVFVLKGFSL
jgi:hypothetical protein